MNYQKQIFDNLVHQLKKYVDDETYVDVGVGAEYLYRVSRERLLKAVKVLQNEGYYVTSIRSKVKRMGNIKLLSKNPITAEEKIVHVLEWNNNRINIRLEAEYAKRVNRNYRDCMRLLKNRSNEKE